MTCIIVAVRTSASRYIIVIITIAGLEAIRMLALTAHSITANVFAMSTVPDNSSTSSGVNKPTLIMMVSIVIELGIKIPSCAIFHVCREQTGPNIFVE